MIQSATDIVEPGMTVNPCPMNEFNSEQLAAIDGGIPGSLVVEEPKGRPTEYDGLHIEPPEWWDVFWQRQFENTGQSRRDTIAMLRKLLGKSGTRPR